MRDRFDGMELWQHLDLPLQECVDHLHASGAMVKFRNNLFTRIVPTVKDVGLWGEKVRRGYEQMGVLQFSEVNIEAVQEDDQKIARDFDARRKHVAEVIAAGG
jgi:hypothetical protein